jgi:hypothetical protein
VPQEECFRRPDTRNHHADSPQADRLLLHVFITVLPPMRLIRAEIGLLWVYASKHNRFVDTMVATSNIVLAPACVGIVCGGHARATP